MSTYQGGSAAEPAPAPYDIIGGRDTVRRVVERIYHWISLDDQLWLRYFANTHLVNLKAHMTEQLCQILGGPKEYGLRDLTEVHQPLRITPAHYDRVADYVLAALLVEHPPPEIVTAVQDVLAASKPAIVEAAGQGEEQR